MTETMVERVARAICCHKNGVFVGCSAKHDGSPFTICQAHTFRDDARAAIEEMREPTESMVNRVAPAAFISIDRGAKENRELEQQAEDYAAPNKRKAIDTWKAMITAALGDG